MTAVERLLKTAKDEVGYLEKKTNANLDNKTANAGRNNYTKYARDNDKTNIYNGKKNGYAWCDIFVDWCFIKTFGFEKGLELTCQPTNSCGAGCTYSARYYKNKNQFYKSNPKPGDQIFFTNDNSKSYYHTGIVVEVKNGRVYTIEGNTSSDPGVVDNGGSVNAKSYPLNASYIGGYGRPNYSIIKEEVKKPAVKENINKEPSIKEEVKKEDIMDLATFKDFYNRVRASLQDNDCSEYSKEARDWAIKNGLVAGNGNLTANGEPNYMWEDILTREQFITVLYRFAKEYKLIK